MNIVSLIFGGVLGAVCASAISCAVMRMGSGRSWVAGRSGCDVCGQDLPWYALIPIVSAFFFRGKTHCCSKSLSGWYLMTELLGAVGGAYVGNLLFSDLRSALLGLVLVLYALYTVRLDAERHVIGTSETLVAILLILGIYRPVHLWQTGVAVAVGGGVFLVQFIASKGRAIGFGDVWIGILLGVAFGWPMVLMVIGLGYVVGAAHALILIARKKAHKKMHLPLGAYLLIAAVLFLWLEPWFLQMYL